jgi:hypothetical protein
VPQIIFELFEFLVCHCLLIRFDNEVGIIHFQKFGYPEKHINGWLRRIRAPFADSGGIFAQLLGQPLVCTLMLNQHDLDTIQVLVVHEVFVGFAFSGDKDSNKMNYFQFIVRESQP